MNLKKKRGELMNYKDIALEILSLVGGKENVNSLTHCVTRLRFVLNDEGLAKTDEIKGLKSVMGVVKQGGQYQIIIGKEVANVYDEVIKQVGEVKQEAPVNKNVWDKFTATVSGIFTPFLGIFAACGILKGILTMCVVFGVMTTEMGVYTVLYAISDSIFYFLPILLGSSSAEKFGINKYLGMIIGASMIYPSIITAASAESFTFLHIPMGLANYTSTVFPVVIAVYFASVLYKGFKKICPKTIAFFLLPLLTLLITVPLSLMIIGPVLNTVSAWLMTLMNMVYNFSPVLCAILLGGPWMILVMFGLHWAFIPLFITEIATTGSCAMMGLLAASQFAFTGAMLAVGAKSKKDKDLRSLSISTGVTCFLGVSEPGMYGVLIPLKKPFITAVIASSIASIPAALMGTKIYAFGASGIFALPSLMNPAGIDLGFYGSIICMILGLASGFLITYIWGIKKEA